MLHTCYTFLVQQHREEAAPRRVQYVINYSLLGEMLEALSGSFLVCTQDASQLFSDLFVVFWEFAPCDPIWSLRVDND